MNGTLLRRLARLSRRRPISSGVADTRRDGERYRRKTPRRVAGRHGYRAIAAQLVGALLLAGLTFLVAACGEVGDDDGPAASPEPTPRERSSLLMAALTRSAVEAYGRTAVTSPQPRDRFLRQVVERAGVLEEARTAGLPLDLLLDSYVATAGPGVASALELLDAGDEPVAEALAALLAKGGTPSHRCVASEAPIAGAHGWILTCTSIEPPGTPLFVAVVATGGTVVIAQETAPRVDQVAATIIRELRKARLPE